MLADFAVEFGFSKSPSVAEIQFLKALLRTMTFEQSTASTTSTTSGGHTSVVPAGCSADKPLIKESWVPPEASPFAAGYTKYSLNKKFRSKSSKVMLQEPDFSKLSGMKSSAVDHRRMELRSATVGAAIVRIMKSRGPWL